MKEHQNGALVFSLVAQKRPVVLEDAAGVRHTYELREMPASEKDKYLNMLAKRMSFHAETGRPQGIRDFEGMQAELLTRCMFNVESTKPVTREEIAGWPSTAAAAIYDAASDLNKIEGEKQKEAEAEAKNA